MIVCYVHEKNEEICKTFPSDYWINSSLGSGQSVTNPTLPIPALRLSPLFIFLSPCSLASFSFIPTVFFHPPPPPTTSTTLKSFVPPPSSSFKAFTNFFLCDGRIMSAADCIYTHFAMLNPEGGKHMHTDLSSNHIKIIQLSISHTVTFFFLFLPLTQQLQLPPSLPSHTVNVVLSLPLLCTRPDKHRPSHLLSVTLFILSSLIAPPAPLSCFR